MLAAAGVAGGGVGGGRVGAGDGVPGRVGAGEGVAGRVATSVGVGDALWLDARGVLVAAAGRVVAVGGGLVGATVARAGAGDGLDCGLGVGVFDAASAADGRPSRTVVAKAADRIQARIIVDRVEADRPTISRGI